MIEALTDELVRLRRLSEDDISELFAAARESIAEIYPWMPWCHKGYCVEETQAWVKRQAEQWDAEREFTFAIRNVDCRFVGTCGLNQIQRDHRIGNLGYWLRTSALGHGYATAATRLVAQYGLREQALRRIEIIASVENLASQRVAERAGAVREGILRQRLCLHDRSHDAVCYSFVATDSLLVASFR